MPSAPILPGIRRALVFDHSVKTITVGKYVCSCEGDNPRARIILLNQQSHCLDYTARTKVGVLKTSAASFIALSLVGHGILVEKY